MHSFKLNSLSYSSHNSIGYGPKTESTKPLYSDVVKGNYNTETITIHPENTTASFFKYVPNPMFDPPIDYSNPSPILPYVSKRGRAIVSGTGNQEKRDIAIIKSKMMDSYRLKLWLNNGSTIMMGTTDIEDQLKYMPQIFKRGSKIIWPVNKVILESKYKIGAIYVDLPIQTKYIIKDYQNINWEKENKIEWEQFQTEKDMLKTFKLEFRRLGLVKLPKEKQKKEAVNLLEEIIKKYHNSKVPIFLSETNLRIKAKTYVQRLNKESTNYVYALVAEEKAKNTITEPQQETPQNGATMRSRSKITKLGEDNYSTWRIKMKLILQDLNLWDFETNLPKKGGETWKEILFNIEDDQLINVEDTTCGTEAWKILAQEHEGKGVKGKILLIKKLINHQYEGGSMEKHCNEVLQIKKQLERASLVIPDEIVLGCLLNGLPPEYEPMIMAWDAVGETLKLSEIITKLKLLSDKTNKSSLALQITTNSKCAICDMNNHETKNCRYNSKNKNNNNNKSFTRKSYNSKNFRKRPNFQRNSTALVAKGNVTQTNELTLAL